MPQTTSTRARSSRPPLRDFKAWEEQLRRVYKKAETAEQARDKALRPRKRAMNQYRLSIYRYYHDVRQAKIIGKLREYVEERDGSQWAGHGHGDEQWVLRLGTNYQQTAKKRKNRSRLAAELKLATLNNVRPDLLLGFLHEAGTIEMIEKDAKKGKKFGWAAVYQ